MSIFAPPAVAAGRGTYVRRRRQPPEIALLGLYEISKILSSATRLDQTLGNVVNVLTSFLDMRLGMIVILDEDGEPEIVASAGWASEAKGKPIQTLPRAVIDQLVATSTPIAVEDVAKDPLFAACADVIAGRLGGNVSFLGVPVKSDDKVIGTLSIVRVWDQENARGFDDDFSFLKMVANLVGQTVRLHRMLSAERKRFLDERRTLEKALDHQLAETRAPAPKVGGIVGESAAIRKVMETIRVVARSNTTVLLRGESGTGKELFARAIHDLSPRKAKAFIKLNCAALPESVLESELFGHEKGAFTGAVASTSRALRTRPRRDAAARRNRRNLGEFPGQAAAHPAGGRIRARRRHAHAQGGRAPDLRDQQEPRAGGGQGGVPRRPLLPHQRHPDLPSAAARSAGRHRAARARLHQPVQRGKRPEARNRRRAAWRCSRAALFPATCAS